MSVHDRKAAETRLGPAPRSFSESIWGEEKHFRRPGERRDPYRGIYQ